MGSMCSIEDPTIDDDEESIDPKLARRLARISHYDGDAAIEQYNSGPFLASDGKSEAGKASWLYKPRMNDDSVSTSPLPAVVVVHGACMESQFLGKLTGLFSGSSLTMDWTYMHLLCEELAAQGFVVMMIGLHDHDEEVVPEAGGTKDIMNCWPCLNYSEFLRAAISHIQIAAQKHLDLEVDSKNIGIMGHSMGGGGVLYAAGEHCRDLISACVSLNPQQVIVTETEKYFAEAVKFSNGPDHSGDYGDGHLAHLAKIACPTLVYGSQAEYNTFLMNNPADSMWPSFASTFAQIPAKHKELYVDDMKELSCQDAHLWFSKPRTYAEGAPLDIIMSFFRRHMLDSDEEVPSKPHRAHQYQVVAP